MRHEDEEEFNQEINKQLTKKIDRLEKKWIDKRRMKRTDQSRKRAAVESVFDERTIFQLNKLLSKGVLRNIEGIISAGKEANVYLGTHESGKLAAIKIYKIDSNTSKWMRNYIIGDPRFKHVPSNVSKIIFLWAQKEYKNLKRAFKVKLRVPEPYHVKNNILIMEYIGFGETPAPKLKDIENPVNKEEIFEEILYFIKTLYQKAGLVHGDLSEFNILYHNQKPHVIDISQAISIHHPKAEVFLVRDIKNIFNYFKKIDVITPDPAVFYQEVITMA
ncbi:MAG: serine protein kinase RIO [Promethearchaeota archaeon]